MARLLGIRLLTLDATVVIVPADVTGPPAARDAQPRLPARSLGALPNRPGAVGGGLAEAVQRINEGAAILAETRNARASRDGGGGGRV